MNDRGTLDDGNAPAFVAGQIFDVELTDFSQVAATAPGWDIRFVPIGAGPLKCRMRAFHTARLQLGIVDYSIGYAVSGHVPHGAWSADVADLANGGRVTSGGVVLDPLQFCVSNDRRDVEVVFGGPTRQYVLSVAEAGMASAVDRLWGEALPTGDRLRFTSTAKRAAFIRECNDWMGVAEKRPVVLSEPTFAPTLEYRIIEALLDGCTPNVAVSASAIRHAAARKARNILLERLNEPLSLAQLCEQLNVNERTLQLGFNEMYGMGPVAYARQSRLAAAQQDIRRGIAPVSSVALRWGFFHPGRFSNYYRAAFGYAPSRTPRDTPLSVSRMNRQPG